MSTQQKQSVWPEGVRHGTHSGWSAHFRMGERPCDPCYFAKQAYDKRRRSAPIQVQKNRAHAHAQSTALRRLKKAHEAEYDRYYLEEKEKVYKERELN